jgi:hypothetical protein
MTRVVQIAQPHPTVEPAAKRKGLRVDRFLDLLAEKRFVDFFENKFEWRSNRRSSNNTAASNNIREEAAERPA